MDAGRAPVRVVAVASLVSVAGTIAANIAIAVLIYARTHSAVWLSVSFLVTFGVTGFLMPLTGVIVDRFDRRRLIIATELAAAVIYVVMVFVDSPPIIIALGFLEALIAMPSSSALRASVPNLAGSQSFAWANGLLDMGFNIGKAAGPLVGGALAATVGVDVVFWVNAASFIIAAALISACDSHSQRPASQTTSAVSWEGSSSSGRIESCSASRSDGCWDTSP